MKCSATAVWQGSLKNGGRTLSLRPAVFFSQRHTLFNPASIQERVRTRMS